MRRARSQAMTLVEVLVWCALSVLMLGILARLSIVGYRVGHEEFERIEAETRMQMIADLIGKDVNLSSPPGVSLTESGQKILFHPTELSPRGALAYQETLTFWTYDPSAKTLLRATTDVSPRPPFDGTPCRLTPEELQGLALNGNFQVTRGFQGLDEFSIKSAQNVPARLASISLNLEIKDKVDLANTHTDLTLRRLLVFRTI